MRCRLQEL